MEDILDHDVLGDDDAFPADAFRCYIRILAMLNRTKSRDGILTLNRGGLGLISGRKHRNSALKLVSIGAEFGLYSVESRGNAVTIKVPNWAKRQEYSPKRPRKAPLTSPTQTQKTTQTPTKKGTKPVPGSLGLVESAVQTEEEKVWEQVLQTFSSYLPRDSRLVLSKKRRTLMMRVEKEFGPGSAVDAVNGYAALHFMEPAGRGFDPMKTFNPECCWSDKIGKYLDANNIARDSGLTPPYQAPTPADREADQLREALAYQGVNL